MELPSTARPVRTNSAGCEFPCKETARRNASRDSTSAAMTALKRVLRIQIEIVSAKAARRIAAALQEQNRLPNQEARECIVDRRRREHKESVRRDAEQHVDLIVTISAAKFEFVAAVNPGHRAGNVEIVLISVARAGDGIADGGVSADLHEWWSRCGVELGAVLKTQVGRQRVVDVLVEQDICCA